jgi:hypothetical protein
MAMNRAGGAAAGRRWTVALAWGVAGLAVLALVPGVRLTLLADSAGLPDAQGSVAGLVAASAAVVLATVSSAAVGAVVASRRPRHPVGWLLLGVGLAVALSILVEWYAKYGLEVRPGSLPGAEYLPGFAIFSFTVIWLACLQLRWLALAAGLLLVALVAGYLSMDGMVLASMCLCVALLPLATGAAILRYRLYDLDRIVSRTLGYGLLTVLLGLGYATVVLGLGRLLPQGSRVAVAAATLAVAAVFQPVRRRIQAAVDRRFNRRRHDAARTIEGFSHRLRDQVDLDTLTSELLAVVDQTIQPTQSSLWLRPSPGATRHQR